MHRSTISIGAGFALAGSAAFDVQAAGDDAASATITSGDFHGFSEDADLDIGGHAWMVRTGDEHTVVLIHITAWIWGIAIHQLLHKVRPRRPLLDRLGRCDQSTPRWSRSRSFSAFSTGRWDRRSIGFRRSFVPWCRRQSLADTRAIHDRTIK